MKRVIRTMLMLLITLTSYSKAEIYNWQTGEVIPGTEGITPAPYLQFTGWNTETHNLNYADFANSDLSKTRYQYTWLVNSRFNNSTLTGGYFYSTVLFAADFTDAEISGCGFDQNSGFTSSQLYSTKSYKEKVLTNMQFCNSDMSGWNFSNQNLSGSSFVSNNYEPFSQQQFLIWTNFSNANLSRTIFSNSN